MFDILKESSAQKEKFRIAANKLLNHCFLMKGREDTKKEYMFVFQNKDMFIQYFDLLGYQLLINETVGVIGINNIFGIGRLQLTKYESIALLIFRLLYIEKRKEIGTFSDEVTVFMEELRTKYAMLNIKAKPTMDKTLEKSIISTLRRYNLLQAIDTDITLDESRILIYPSIIMAAQMDDITSYYESIQNRLLQYGEIKEEDNAEEITLSD